MPHFLTYAKFQTSTAAEEVAAILLQNNIECFVEHDKTILDEVYIGKSLDPMYILKIKETNFIEANNILKQSVNIHLEDINKDYYLFMFSKNELIDVVNNPQEWNYFDQAIAEKLLKQNHSSDNDSKEIIEQKTPFVAIRLEQQWIIMQYILSFLIPFAGIIIGLATLLASKTLYNGNKVKMFSENDRMHGKNYLIIGILLFIFLILYNSFFNNY